MSDLGNKNDGADVREVRLKQAGVQAASLVGQEGLRAAKHANLASAAICAAHARQAAEAICKSEFVKAKAARVVSEAARAAEAGAKSGAFEQVKGHFVEAMTIEQYNAAGKLVGKSLTAPNSPTHRAYDAVRIATGNGRSTFAGGVQIKTSASGVEKAIEQINAVKAGSASKATLIVSEDQVAEATRRAAGRIRVRGNGVSRAQATKRLDQGVKGLAGKGSAATSHARVLGKAGAIGAAVNVSIGAACDAGKLRSGELSGREFAENRGVDAAEGAGGAVLGTAAASGAGVAATAALGTAAGASFAAGAGSMGTAAVAALGGLGAPGVAAAGALGTVTAPVAIPVVAGVAASVIVGIGVSQVGKAVRGEIDRSRQKSKNRERRRRSEDTLGFSEGRLAGSIKWKRERIDALCQRRERERGCGRDPVRLAAIDRRIEALQRQVVELGA